MKKRKVYEISVIDKTYSKTISDETKFYTSDTALELSFELKETEYNFESAEIVLLNIDDRSLVTRPVAKVNNDFVYELDDDIIAHYGEWRGQLRFEAGETYVSSPVKFRIENDLSNDRPPQLSDVQSWVSLKRYADSLTDELKQAVLSIEGIEDTFNANELARQATFEKAEQSRQTTFEYAESERNQTFNTNEETRQANETARVEAEKKRNETVKNIETRQNSVENQFISVQEELTEKDVISAPEIIAARNGEDTLKARLDKENNEVTAQLAQISPDVASLNKEQLYSLYDTILPSDYKVQLPFNTWMTWDGKMAHDYDLNQHLMGADFKVYVDADLGNDTTGNGSENLPYKTMSKVKTVLEGASWTKATLYVKGMFQRSTMPTTKWNIPANSTLNIVGDSNTLFVGGDVGTKFTWTPDGTAYKTNRTNCNNVIDDKSMSDSDGIIPPLKKVASVTECQNTPGSWYSDNATVWVRAYDDRQPDDNFYLLLYSVSTIFALDTNSTVYIKGLKRYGNMGPDGTDGKGTYIMDGVTITAAGHINQGDGLASVDVGLCMSFNCKIAYCPKDGFNYHYLNTLDTTTKLAIEIDCLSYENGRDQGDQASTTHEGVNVFRANGKYLSSVGSALVDVGGADSVVVASDCISTAGMGINLNGANHRLTLLNSSAMSTVPNQHAVIVETARMKNNLCMPSVNITNLIPI